MKLVKRNPRRKRLLIYHRMRLNSQHQEGERKKLKRIKGLLKSLKIQKVQNLIKRKI